MAQPHVYTGEEAQEVLCRALGGGWISGLIYFLMPDLVPQPSGEGL